MAIELIPNQQFIFNDPVQLCNDADKRRYCQLLQESDFAYIQFKQTPCGENLICSPEFEVSDELVEDGDFETDPTLSGWTLTDGAAWDNVNKRLGYPFSSGVGHAEYGLSLEQDCLYRLTYTIGSNFDEFTCQAFLGGTSGTLITIADTGSPYTFTEYLYAGVGAELLFEFGSQSGWLDDVSLVEVPCCWNYSNTNLVFGTGVCHISGVATDIVQENVLINTLLYKFQITLSNVTQGNVEVFAGTLSMGTISDNGVQNVYGVSDGTDLTLSISSDFDGCITNVSVYVLRKNFQFILKDLDDNFVADLNLLVNPTVNEQIQTVNEYVTLELGFFINSIKDLNDEFLNYGCYKICFFDPCRTSIENDNIWESFISWTASDPDIIHSTVTNEDGWLMTATGNGDGLALITTNGPASTYPFRNWTHNTMQMIIDVHFVTGLIENNTNSISIIWPDGGVETSTVIATNVVSNTAYSFHVVTNVDNSGAGYQDKMAFSAQFTGISSGDINQIRYVEVTAIPMTNQSEFFSVEPVEYCSNCLSWKEVQTCTSVIKGEPTSDYGLGFFFNLFQLQNRLRVLPISPIHVQDEEDYLYSSGVRQLTYSSTEKYWVIWFDYVDQITHDNINAIINSSDATIDGVSYFFKKGNYAPEWDKDYRFKLAQSRVEAKIKDQSLFTNNCS